MECKVNGCGAIINPDGRIVAACPKCHTVNCLNCRAVHVGVSCKAYRQKLQVTQVKRTEQGSTAEPAVVTPAAPPEASPRKSTPAPVVDVPDELLVECKVENCIGQAFVDKDADMFRCPVCNYYTCLKCMVVHQSLTCEQYRQNKEGGVPSPVYKPPKQPNVSDCMLFSQSTVTFADVQRANICSPVIVSVVNCQLPDAA